METVPLEIYNKRIAFMDRTISYFTSEKRSFKKGGFICSYISYSSNSEGCAIGREIEDKSLCASWDKSNLGVNEIFSELPIELQELGCTFLSEMQRLHDTWHNWNSMGLTYNGITEVTLLATRHCNIK